MPQPAQSHGGGQVISFPLTDPHRLISDLSEENSRLQEENRQLHVNLHRLRRGQARRRADRASLALVVRNLCQEQVSRDKNSFVMTALALGIPVERVTEEMAVSHWYTHGGPEGFDRDFPTIDAIRKHFLRLHSTRGRPRDRS